MATARRISLPWKPELDAAAVTAAAREVAFAHTVRATDRAAAEAALTLLYQTLGFKPVPFVWFQAPDDLLRQYAIDANEQKKPGDYARFCCEGQFEAWWLARYEFAQQHLGWDEERELLHAALAVARTCGCYLPTDVRCYCADLPITIAVDAENRPHNLTGPAIGYANGFGVYCVHGTMVPDRYVIERNKLTPADVDAEANAEVRVALLEIYGMGRYLADSRAEKIDEVPADTPGYGARSPITGKVYPFGLRGARLWRRTNQHGDVIQAVELINSTAEINGRRKTYWIGVTAKALTVEQAVAESYGVPVVEYQPEWET